MCDVHFTFKDVIVGSNAVVPLPTNIKKYIRQQQQLLKVSNS